MINHATLTEHIEDVAISPNGKQYLSASWDGVLRLWDLSSGKCIRSMRGHRGRVNCTAFFPDGRWAVSGASDHSLKLWNLESGESEISLIGHMGSITAVAVSPDGRWVLSGSVDRTIRFWEIDWEIDFPDLCDWNEGARPYLENFVHMQRPLGSDQIFRDGRPTYNDCDFENLLNDLEVRGYGWLRREEIRRELDKMLAGFFPDGVSRIWNL